MSINFGLQWISQETAADRPHILGFNTARSVADDGLLDIWNGPTNASRVFRINKDGQVQIEDGTEALPGIAGANEKASGLFRVGANNWGFSINASKVLDISATGLAITGTLSVTGAGAITGDLSVGGSPALAGIVRIPNAVWIAGRNAAGTANINIVQIAAANNRVWIGNVMQTGDILPDTDVSRALGATGERWFQIFVGVNGLDVEPGSDIDADLLTVGVTGTPRLFWDESEDAFRFTQPVILNNAKGVVTGSRAGNAALADLLTELATLGLITDSTSA